MLVLNYVLADGTIETEDGLTEEEAQGRIQTAFPAESGGPRTIMVIGDKQSDRVFFPVTSIVKIIIKTDRRVL